MNTDTLRTGIVAKDVPWGCTTMPDNVRNVPTVPPPRGSEPLAHLTVVWITFVGSFIAICISFCVVDPRGIYFM